MKRTVCSLSVAVLLCLAGPAIASAGDSDKQDVTTLKTQEMQTRSGEARMATHKLPAGEENADSRIEEMMAIARDSDGQARVNAMLGVLEELLAERTIARWAAEETPPESPPSTGSRVGSSAKQSCCAMPHNSNKAENSRQ